MRHRCSQEEAAAKRKLMSHEAKRFCADAKWIGWFDWIGGCGPMSSRLDTSCDFDSVPCGKNRHAACNGADRSVAEEAPNPH